MPEQSTIQQPSGSVGTLAGSAPEGPRLSAQARCPRPRVRILGPLGPLAPLASPTPPNALTSQFAVPYCLKHASSDQRRAAPIEDGPDQVDGGGPVARDLGRAPGGVGARPPER